jgi:hypothetical protein
MATAVDSPEKVVREIDAAVGTTQVTQTESARRRSAYLPLPPAPGAAATAPIPLATAAGRSPMAAASDVMSTGRIRTSALFRMASRISHPSRNRSCIRLMRMDLLPISKIIGVEIEKDLHSLSPKIESERISVSPDMP